MQSYNKTPEQRSLSKKILLGAIDFLRYKVERDKLTVAEAESLSRFFLESLNLQGTADEFAEFYGKSKNNVKVVICRKIADTPIRKILYPFAKFARAIPSTWYDGIESQR